MKETTDKKSLIKSEERLSFFGKVRMFFKKLFGKKLEKETGKENENIKSEIDNEKDSFTDSIKIDSDVDADIELLQLQSDLRNGIIKIEDLTESQEEQLIDLYDKQIAIKKARIEELKKKIERYYAS